MRIRYASDPQWTNNAQCHCRYGKDDSLWGWTADRCLLSWTKVWYYPTSLLPGNRTRTRGFRKDNRSQDLQTAHTSKGARYGRDTNDFFLKDIHNLLFVTYLTLRLNLKKEHSTSKCKINNSFCKSALLVPRNFFFYENMLSFLEYLGTAWWPWPWCRAITTPSNSAMQQPLENSTANLFLMKKLYEK